MAGIQTTNRWHQAVRQQLGTTADASGLSAFGTEVSFILQFDQLLCAWLIELSGQEIPPEAVSFESLLVRLLQNDPVVAQIVQIDEASRRPASWIYEFVMARRSILIHQGQKAATSPNLIATQSIDGNSTSDTFRSWLEEFEQWLESFRELNQEY